MSTQTFCQHFLAIFCSEFSKISSLLATPTKSFKNCHRFYRQPPEPLPHLNHPPSTPAKMPLKDEYILPAAADMHVHLRNAPGPIAELVTPTIRPAGVDVVFVMPNLAPRPVVSVDEALEYKRQLQAIDSSITYLMSLYLHSSITPDEIRKAKKAGIAGVKVAPPPTLPSTTLPKLTHPQAYPKGATTNSEWGVLSFDPFHDVLKAMEEEGIVLNLHGEVPSSPADGVTVMNAESKFLPTLRALVSKYPNLKIVLEHCTTADAVETVRSFGENVVGTIVRLSLPPSCPPLTQPDRPPPLPPRRRLVRQRGTSLFPPPPCLHHLTPPPPAEQLLQTLGQIPLGPPRPPRRPRPQQRQILPRHRLRA